MHRSPTAWISNFYSIIMLFKKQIISSTTTTGWVLWPISISSLLPIRATRGKNLYKYGKNTPHRRTKLGFKPRTLLAIWQQCKYSNCSSPISSHLYLVYGSVLGPPRCSTQQKAGARPPVNSRADIHSYTHDIKKETAGWRWVAKQLAVVWS